MRDGVRVWSALTKTPHEALETLEVSLYCSVSESPHWLLTAIEFCVFQKLLYGDKVQIKDRTETLGNTLNTCWLLVLLHCSVIMRSLVCVRECVCACQRLWCVFNTIEEHTTCVFHYL